MTTALGLLQVASLGSFTINAPNTIAFAPGNPARIKRIILAYTTANTTAGNALTIQRRPVAGTAANQVTLATVTTTAAIAAGQVEVIDFGTPKTPLGTPVSGAPGIGGQRTFNSLPDFPVINPGEDLAIVTGGEGTGGVCNVFVEYWQLPYQLSAVSNETVLTPVLV